MPRREIDLPGDFVHHACYRSPSFARYVATVAVIGILPVFLLMLSRALVWLAHASAGPAGFLEPLAVFVFGSAWVSAAAALPAYGVVILTDYLTPSLYPRERAAILMAMAFFIFGSIAVSIAIAIFLF